MRTVSTRASWLVAAVLLSSLLASCGTLSAAAPASNGRPSGQVATGTAASQPLTPVKLAINKLGAMTNVWVAQQNGIFAQHGLDLEMVEIPNTGDNIPALQSHSVDMALQIPGSAMVAKEGGFDIVLVGQNETAGTTPPVSNALMVGASSTASSVKDLAGRKLGTSSPRGQSYAALKSLFQKEGVAIDSLQIVEAPFSSHADLLRSGQVDAVVALDPYTTQISKAGYGRVLSWFMVETIPDQPVGAFWTLRSWAQQHPAEIAAFNDAIKESHEYLYADTARAKQLVSQFSGLDSDLVKEMPLISWKSTVDTAVWQAMIDLMVEQGELKSRHDVSEYLAK